MKYIEICYTDQLPQRIEDLAGRRVGRIPLKNTRDGTQYWIDEQGSSVFVAHLVCDRYFIDRVRIYEAGYKSLNSKPCFKYRTVNGIQNTCTLDKAVYGAFILNNQMPERSIILKDFDLSNCSVSNLLTESEQEIILKSNLSEYSRIYSENYDRMVDYCMYKFGRSYDDAQDIVSDAFISMCTHIKKCKSPIAVWVKLITRRLVFRMYAHYHIPLENLLWLDENGYIKIEKEL